MALSLSPEESGIGGFTANELKDVWDKAGKILQNENCVQFPQQPDMYVCFAEDKTFSVVQLIYCKFTCKEKCHSLYFMINFSVSTHWLSLRNSAC